MSHQSYSSIGTSRRKGHHPIDRYTDVDRSVYTVGQTLASIVNDPRTAGQNGGFWGLAHDASQAPAAPALDPTKYPLVTKADVQSYVDLVHEAYDRFIRDRQSLKAFDAQQHHPGSPVAGSASQGEPFMAAMQAVPVHYFQEGFFGSWDVFFEQFCQDQSTDELHEHIDQLNKILDVVELQLLREVASRSESFFQAASTLQDLLAMLADSSNSICGLRKSLATADEQLCSTAGAVKALQLRKSNLQATVNITKGLEEVVAAQQALDCLLESQDYAGALNLLYELKISLEQPALLGLQCVRHLPPRLADTTAAVEGALANEFLNILANSDLRRVVLQAASDAEAQPDAGVLTDDADAGHWQLPRSTTTGSNPPAAAAVEQMQEKVMPLAVGLYRCDRLLATLQLHKANAGDELKGAIRDAVQQVLPPLLSAAGGMSSVASQQLAAEAQSSEQLQLLHHGSFMVLLYAAARVIFSCVDHVVCVGRLLEDILQAVNTPASQLLSVRKESFSTLQVVVDVGLGRWVKLLAARGAAHTRLKQYELRQLLDLSEQVAAHCESLGSRIPSSFRAALQGQCKALLDASHARCMNQLQHLLESDQWVSVEVPGGFQAIVDRMVARCGEGAALLDGRLLAPAAAGLPSAGSLRPPGPVRPADGTAAAEGTAVSEQHSSKLHLSGKSFYLVNSALMLLKMLDEYRSLHEIMPQFGAEIVHRELELLKLFNGQTAALVLGAGAMRTAGLRSISAKQLAMSCQSVAMVATLLPLLRAGSLALISQPRRALLMPEFDRLLQDLTLHMDEVHSKLVDIMRDRLAAAVQVLPAEMTAAHPGSQQVSQTVLLLSKQLGTLRSVLVPLLLKDEVESIFGAVTRAYSDGLAELFEDVMDQDAASEGVVRANALTMLQAFRQLPLDPARANNHSSRLSTTYTKHFGLPPWDMENLGNIAQQQHLEAQQPNLQQQHEEVLQQLEQQPGHVQQQEQKQQQHIQQGPGTPCVQQHRLQTDATQLQLQVSGGGDEFGDDDGIGLGVYQEQTVTQQQQDQQCLVHQQKQQFEGLPHQILNSRSDGDGVVPGATRHSSSATGRGTQQQLKLDGAADAAVAAVTRACYALDQQAVQEQASSCGSHGEPPETPPPAAQQAAAASAAREAPADGQSDCTPDQGKQQQQQLGPLVDQVVMDIQISTVGQQPAVGSALETHHLHEAIPLHLTSRLAAGQFDAGGCCGDVGMSQDVAAVARANSVVTDGRSKGAAPCKAEAEAHVAAERLSAEAIIAVRGLPGVPAVACGPGGDEPPAQGMVDAHEQPDLSRASESNQGLQGAAHSAPVQVVGGLGGVGNAGEQQLLKDLSRKSAASTGALSSDQSEGGILCGLNIIHGLEHDGDKQQQQQQQLGGDQLQGTHQQNGVVPAGSGSCQNSLTSKVPASGRQSEQEQTCLKGPIVSRLPITGVVVTLQQTTSIAAAQTAAASMQHSGTAAPQYQ